MKPQQALILALAAAIICRVVPAASAQTASPPQPANPPLAVSQEWSRYDTNRNGRLDPAEKRALVRERMLERRQQRAARAQAAAEARKAETAAHYARQKISPVLLEQYDRNRNGRLDPHEWERHRQDLNRLLAEPRQRPQPAPAAAAEPGK